MTDRVLVFDRSTVLDAIDIEAAIECIKEAFVRFAQGEWTMPAKVYLQSPPHGDFRAMPAAGGGLALLKWVTSFPSNRERGLPVVIGTILVSDSTTGQWLALVEGGAVTALRTGAAAAVATQALAVSGARTASIIGCGLHGRWAGLCLKSCGFDDGVCSDRDPHAARGLADELGWRAGPISEALRCDVVTLVTPGRAPVVGPNDLQTGMHINALGADGPGKAEMDVEAVGRCSVFCDEWTQASHGGELTGAVERGLLTRERVTELGAVLAGDEGGRASEDEVTLFDSTGLAIQDLAIARALLEEHAAGRIEARELSL